MATRGRPKTPLTLTDEECETLTPWARRNTSSQALIVENPGFTNKINSISLKHAYYDDAVSWGQSWLRENGY